MGTSGDAKSPGIKELMRVNDERQDYPAATPIEYYVKQCTDGAATLDSGVRGCGIAAQHLKADTWVKGGSGRSGAVGIEDTVGGRMQWSADATEVLMRRRDIARAKRKR